MKTKKQNKIKFIVIIHGCPQCEGDENEIYGFYFLKMALKFVEEIAPNGHLISIVKRENTNIKDNEIDYVYKNNRWNMPIKQPDNFICFVCKIKRERGVIVEIKHGEYKGCVVKVCKSKECKNRAKKGYIGGEKWS